MLSGPGPRGEYVITHPHQSDRLESLRSYGVLDSEAETEYDALTALAAMICDTPIALVTLVDANRQWFKSRHGVTVTQTSRRSSFAEYTVAAAVPLLVPDAALDDRFARTIWSPDRWARAPTPGYRWWAVTGCRWAPSA
jgi:hypothetical protein